MENNHDGFIVDTNSFITPFNTYYSMENFPSFWNWFKGQFEGSDHNLILPKVIYDELRNGKDDDHLSLWIKQNLKMQIFSDYENSDTFWKNFGIITNFIHSCGTYKLPGIDEWDKTGKADPILVALGMTYGWKIVTFENPTNLLQTKNTTKKKPKIPDIAKYFDVDCVSIYDVEKDLDLVI